MSNGELEVTPSLRTGFITGTGDPQFDCQERCVDAPLSNLPFFGCMSRCTSGLWVPEPSTITLPTASEVSESFSAVTRPFERLVILAIIAGIVIIGLKVT